MYVDLWDCGDELGDLAVGLSLQLTACWWTGVGAANRTLKESDVCFAKSNEMSLHDFAEKALACSVDESYDGFSSETCCESVRSSAEQKNVRQITADK